METSPNPSNSLQPNPKPNPKAKPKAMMTLADQQRQSIAEALLKRSKNGKLEKGTLNFVAELFSVHVRTVSRIWKRARDSVKNGATLDVSRKPSTGRRRVQIDYSKFAEIPLSRRKDLRSLSEALGVPKSTLHRRVKEGAIRPDTEIAITLDLTEENKKARLQFCLSMLEPSSLEEDEPIFKDMLNHIHIGVTWFYMSKESERYYLLPDEIEPTRTCKSKRFITKVMFLAAVARPRSDQEFSGKIGIFPFISKEPAKRTSKYRAAGTLESKPLLSVTNDVIKSCMIQKVLPAIRDRWPHSGSVDTIFIQQDNAKPHIDVDDPEFVEAAAMDGFDIRLSFQPPNSPDMNVLELDLFRAIQSLQQEQLTPKTTDELIYVVTNSFDELKQEDLNHAFLSMQQCMIEVMKVNGGNDYAMGQNGLERDDSLPCQLHCERALVEGVKHYLQD